jgi:hypothetical protein
MTRRLEALVQFIWEFVIGDDWRVAAGVAVALVLTAVLAGAGVAAWWALPLAATVLLGYSLWRAAAAGR